ncbi:2-oxo-4-hydroxy-4-carboxy-5-ureidoimidazoline decarboxylase [Streptacidiphilus sp. EB129]|uniref:2-oxo-4-hydroxy-4-carboxy-5-ureidoimidazoline decarboxylase n=1 Tax=Streptacidiphilus sp. EB129 TaxID=3156262 RepID=UPI003511027F
MAESATSPLSRLARLNGAADAALDAQLIEICSSPTWATLVRAARPWADAEALHAANATAMAALDGTDLHDAMSGHARIGKPKTDDATSQREQAGIDGAAAALLDELHAANAGYEAKFGHVFLICATGRTAETMLAALRERFDNDAATEREIVRGELRKINDIRLDRLLHDV